MPKIKDLSSKFKIPIAEKELALLVGQEAMAARRGGLSLFSDSFKRGHGDDVFGSDRNGIWLGAAEFVNAPFSVDMEGNIIATGLDLSAYLSKAGAAQTLSGDINVGSSSVKIDGDNTRIVIHDGTTNRGVFGDV